MKGRPVPESIRRELVLRAVADQENSVASQLREQTAKLAACNRSHDPMLRGQIADVEFRCDQLRDQLAAFTEKRLELESFGFAVKPST